MRFINLGLLLSFFFFWIYVFLDFIYFFSLLFLQYCALVLFCIKILPDSHSSQNFTLNTQICSPSYTFHFVSTTISFFLCLISAHLPHGPHTSKGTLRVSVRGMSAFHTDDVSSRKQLNPYWFGLMEYLGNLIAKFLMSVMIMTDFHFLII